MCRRDRRAGETPTGPGWAGLSWTGWTDPSRAAAVHRLSANYVLRTTYAAPHVYALGIRLHAACNPSGLTVASELKPDSSRNLRDDYA